MLDRTELSDDGARKDDRTMEKEMKDMEGKIIVAEANDISSEAKERLIKSLYSVKDCMTREAYFTLFMAISGLKENESTYSKPIETVKFTVEKRGKGIYRISANEDSSKYTDFNTDWICDLDTLFYSMTEIEEKLKDNCIVLFNTFDFTDQK